MKRSPGNTDRWERTRDFQIIGVRTTLFLIIFLTAALAAVIFWPVRNSLRRRDIREFEIRSELVDGYVSGFFDQAYQLALQLPSRTRIREELAAYLDGRRNLDSYVSFTGSKLEDAMTASDGILGVIRLDPDWNPLVSINMSLDSVPECSISPKELGLFSTAVDIGGESAALYCVPIEHPGSGLVGYDIIAISLAPLETELRSDSDRYEPSTVLIFDADSLDIDNPQIVSDPGWETADRPSGLDVTELERCEACRSDRFVTSAFNISSEWKMVVIASTASLYHDTRRDIILFGTAILLLGTIAALVAAFVLHTLSRRTLEETDALQRIVDEKTGELRLLLKEIHHRVKNDIYLTTTLIEVKSMETASDEAKEILAEAVSSLRVTGELYELIHVDEGLRRVELRSLIGRIADRLRANASAGGVIITSNVEELAVPRKIARPVAIITNELVTNALKHGGETGLSAVEISISLSGPAVIRIIVRDDGSGFSEEALAGDFGYGLEMTRSMAAGFGGSMNLRNDNGAVVEVFLKNPEGKPDDTVSG